MHAQQAEPLPRLSDDVRELLGLLARYRLRLGAEGLLRYCLRGLSVGLLLLAIVSTVDWLVELGLQSIWRWAAVLLPVVGALGVALAGWPSQRQTARTADRRLHLEERLGTAVELGNPHRLTPSGRFDRLQLVDAIASLHDAPRTWPSIARGARRELVLAVALGVLAGGSLLLPNVPRPRLLPAADTPSFVEPGALADERSVPPDALNFQGVNPSSIAQQAVEADLAPRVRQAQAEQQALDRLAQALGQVSPGKAAADAIQRGDYATARDQLASLGEESDQLSDAAKKQLAQALQAAAGATSVDRQLADRERQAAGALSRNNYSDQRNALRQLGDQVERSGAKSMPAAQMARDAGRLQQQQAAQSGGQSQSAAGQTSPASSIQAQQGGGMNGPQGGQSSTGAGAGDQNGAGAGTGSTDGVGDPGDRLATAGQLVEVPTKLGPGPGQRPLDGTEDQIGTDPSAGARSVAEAAQPQQTGQVSPEQNLVPGDQRPVVRGYFR